METYPEPPRLPPVVTSPGPPTFMAHPVRLLRGLYADLHSSGAPPWEVAHSLSLARCVAACQAVTSARCLSHESAALVHGLSVRGWEPDVSVVVPSKPRRPGTRVPSVRGGRTDVLLRRRSLRMLDDDITTVSGLPVTTVLRTVLDCAFDVPPSESICIADSALRALVRPTRDQRTASEHRAAAIRRRLQDELEAMAGRSGARRARAVIAIASPFAESPGESIMRCFVTALGLPAPVLQLGVEDGIEVVVYFPDLAWPALKIYLEFDGRLKYESDADLWREKKRRDALARLGWRGEHVTWDDLRNPARLCAKILALFPPEIVHRARLVPELWA